MIRSMQVNRVVSDLEVYAAATQMFVDKYQGVPGDITNATTFWSSSIVANGNGNGQMNDAPSASTAGEIFGAWEQMALAGLIKGTFTGVAGPAGTYDGVLGVNMPASSGIAATGFSWYHRGMMSGATNHYDGFYGNTLHFGTKTPVGETWGLALTPAEAYAIDQKMDDGIPGTGNIRPYTGAVLPTDCSTGTNSAGASSAYNTASYSGVACALAFISGI
jgi:hypothetical protein